MLNEESITIKKTKSIKIEIIENQIKKLRKISNERAVAPNSPS